MKKVVILLFLLFFITASLSLDSQDRRVKVVSKERRIALVIGNGAYKTSPLRNPVNDANDIADVLREKGFDVTLRTNASKPTMINSIREFGSKLRRGGVGLFYYAGHGMQVEGMNYLIPIGANIKSEHEIPLESVNVNRILGYMKNANNRLNMLILDACRDNPFARSFRSSSRGLAQMDSPIGTLIAYSTSPGKTAADGSGRNGIYTNHLLTHIRTSNLEVGQMLRVVRSKVRRETNGKQVPWESTSLEGSFYFSTGAGPQQVDQVAKPEITKPQIKPDVQPTLSGIQLRSSYQTLGKNDVGSMLKKRGFFSKNYGWNSSWCNPGGDFKNQYESKIINRDKVVIDHTTGLMWHQSGSSDGMVSEKAEQWIRDLNNSEYAGYKDWRLPTLEEGASLLENSKQNGNLYIDPVFSKRQTWIWTGDKFDPGAAWVVDFVEGNVYGSDLDGRNCVRPVRPQQ